MRICSLCGLEYGSQYSFCPEDGATLINIEETESGPAQSSSVVEPVAALDEAGPISESSFRVLYCPACAGEYPLTFKLCPIDGARLSPEKMAATIVVPSSTIALERHEAAPPTFEPEPSIQEEPVAEFVEPRRQGRVTIPLEVEEPAHASYAASGGPRPTTTRQRFNRINLILLGALSLLMVAALYAVGRGSREAVQAAKSNQPVGVAQDKPSVFVATPQTAVEYSEPAESDSPDQPDEEEWQPGTTLPFSRPQARREPTRKRQPQATPVGRPIERPRERPIEQTRPRQVTVPNRPQSQTVRVVDLRVDANLIRVRSRRTPSGYRYDLTFTLYDPAGRSFYWEKLLVTTRSASGRVRNQTIAFSHRQGANGLLTFTIGVDLNGATESDWRGSVVCTSLGTDGHGKIIRAGFRADLAPW